MGKKDKEAKKRKHLEKELQRQEREEKKGLDRTIDTLFRVTIPHHMELSALADQKANILITICAIVLGLILVHKPELLYDPNFMYPTISLGITCIVTMLLAIYVTMPKLSTDLFKGQKPPPKPNLLFFGYFGRLPYAAYAEKMDELMRNRPELVDSLLRDLHSLGVVLAKKKYKYLRYGYLCFSIGIVISVLILAISLIGGHR